MTRLLSRLTLAAVLVAGLIAGPAVVAPSTVDAAQASVYSSCNISGCADARTARSGWSSLGFPTTRAWYQWPAGKYNFAGGRYYNREGELPANATYYEYDVIPRNQGAARDAKRIIINRSTGATWYSPNHYTDFYRL
ncbi:ribonuclease domain-containing protein [Dactylosporangium sp. AC04546]|uniref:ribonuclease domain-containing protein n=1 Tax=Dactylosporangium sp. AC04546 TaxID=2862460 RepID=UPI0027E0AE40|nr:ribonuclease domain-containing protein [Dactylosporangium sp. AC04546]WVK81636.1 ribonuclease domain-containing protein [Dactylosporangium sp. AC04546]